jgi:hypothetical protein
VVRGSSVGSSAAQHVAGEMASWRDGQQATQRQSPPCCSLAPPAQAASSLLPRGVCYPHFTARLSPMAECSATATTAPQMASESRARDFDGLEREIEAEYERLQAARQSESDGDDEQLVDGRMQLFGGADSGDDKERQCRICLGGEDDEPELGRLISPCMCDGSMRVSVVFVSSQGC